MVTKAPPYLQKHIDRYPTIKSMNLTPRKNHSNNNNKNLAQSLRGQNQNIFRSRYDYRYLQYHTNQNTIGIMRSFGDL